MTAKVSLDSLDSLVLPDLEDTSAEEELFESSESAKHQEHKLLEAHSHALNLAKQRIRKLEIENDDLALLGPHRRHYSWWILGFVFLFVFTTFLLLVLSAVQIETPQSGQPSTYHSLIEIDNEVMMTLLATNTVQVVGLLYVVAKWLFPNKSEKSTQQGKMKAVAQ
tara:strand:- start:1009 stop:1506 length:498 start_codon:yes stop_codon:yes gene_type:complete